MLIFWVITASILFTTSLSLRCYPPRRGMLPIPAHCRDLAGALTYAASLPRGNDLKRWGRSLPSAGDTENVPKLYWLAGRGPTTCAVELDAVPSKPDAVEEFGLKAVAQAAARIVNICVYGQSRVGNETLGPTEGIVAELRRTDSPRFRLWHKGGFERLTLANGAELMAGSIIETKPPTDRTVLPVVMNNTDGGGNRLLHSS